MSDDLTSQKKTVVSRGIRWYFNTVLSGIKGAIGIEAFTLSKQMWGNVLTTAKANPCPRCREVSLFKVASNHWICQYPPCQLSGTSDILSRASILQVSALILAIAKGVPPRDIERRIHGCRIASRVAWITATCFLIYGLSWLWEGRLLLFIWTGLLAFAISLHGLRYAFQIWRIHYPQSGGLPNFLRKPYAWFV